MEETQNPNPLDFHKEYTLGEEIANSLTHGIGTALSLVGLVLLLTLAHQLGDFRKIVSFSIYGSTLILLYFFEKEKISMKKFSLLLILILGITAPSLAGEQSVKNPLVENLKHRMAVAQQSAIVIALCEDGGKTAAGRFIEGLGRFAFEPLVKPFYRTQIWLVGSQATPQAFLSAIREAAKTHKAVDILLFAHGAPSYTKMAGGILTPKALVEGLKGRGGDRVRMLYTTTCYSSHQFLKAWKDSGAWAVRGMSGVNRPLDFPRFFLGWLIGENYSQANRGGFQFNQEIHKKIQPLQPKIKEEVLKAMKALKEYQPKTPEEEKAKRALHSFLYLAYKWFQRPWKIEESTPQIYGGEARIDRLPEKK